MKRFYCTICQKVKRVRSLPDNVESEFAKNPIDRVGECKHHSNLNAIAFDRIPAKHTQQPRQSVKSTPVNTPKNPKGRR